MFLLRGWLIFCSAFLKNEIPILWGLVRFNGLSREIAKSLLQAKVNIDIIVISTGLTIEEIKSLK
jgi:hypothetical protein